MSRMLGVCWHSPTSDRWPCQPSDAMLRGGLNADGTDGFPAPEAHADHPLRVISPPGCQACGHLEARHRPEAGCLMQDCDCDAFEGPEAPYDDPIETDLEAALGSAEEQLSRVRAALEELDARAEAAKYLSTTSEESEDYQMTEWGRYYGYAGAAKLLREAIR